MFEKFKLIKESNRIILVEVEGRLVKLGEMERTRWGDDFRIVSTGEICAGEFLTICRMIEINTDTPDGLSRMEAYELGFLTSYVLQMGCNTGIRKEYWHPAYLQRQKQQDVLMIDGQVISNYKWDRYKKKHCENKKPNLPVLTGSMRFSVICIAIANNIKDFSQEEIDRIFVTGEERKIANDLSKITKETPGENLSIYLREILWSDYTL